MNIQRYPTLAELARGAAADLAAIVRETLAEQSTCHVVLSGGKTPQALYAELVARGREALPWDRIELWWGDERCVPPTHADSNFAAARAELLEPLRLDASRWHRIAGEAEPEAAARAYEDEIHSCFGDPPRFDLVLLGMGADGHTASLFPGSPALAETARLVAAAPGPNGAPRITLTLPPLNTARHVRFLVAGADKAATLAAVLGGPAGHYPAQLVQGSDLVWLVDDAAARHLNEDPKAP